MPKYHYKEDVEECIKICKKEKDMRLRVFQHEPSRRIQKVNEIDKVIACLEWIKTKVKARQRGLFNGGNTK